MREERIIIYPLTYMELLSYEGIVQVNEHGYVKLKGQIPFEKRQECMEAGKKLTWFKVAVVADAQESCLFYGVLSSMQLEVINETCIVQIEIKTGSSLMDKKESFRSFQNDDLFYHEVLEICNSEYYSYTCDKIMTEAKESKIGSFLMQYMETDWNFIKRLASRVQTIVVPEYKTVGVKYYFGLPNRRDSLSENTCEYAMNCDMQEYSLKKAKGMSITPEDTITYIWEDREIYELGQNKTINGRAMYIWKIKTILKQNELYHTYYMKSKRGIHRPLQHNQKMSGASVFATINDVKNECVKIQIEDDSNRGSSGSCWFPFSTVYSSEDGTGWYCMPEKGDRVRLHFPTCEEENAYVISAYHEKGADLRKEPAVKFWRNQEGKEIRLTPEYILMTNNDGTYIQLSDVDGVVIKSSGSVSIKAKKGLSITSKTGTIELSAADNVTLKQGKTKMRLGDNLNMQGSRIIL